MTSAAASAAEPPRASAATSALAAPTRLVAAFSGTRGLAVKIVLLALANALAAWAAAVLASKGKWPAFGVLLAATLAIDAIYLARRKTVPLKFLVPGTIFLLAFQVAPIVYTVSVAFTNYSTGHILSKSQAIEGIELNSLQAPPNGQTYAMAPARDSSGGLVLVLKADNGKTFVGTKKGLKAIPTSSVTTDANGAITGATGYTLLKGAALFGLDKQLNGYTVPTGGKTAIRPEGLDTAADLEPSLRYDPKRDAFVKTVGAPTVYHDDGKGSFVSPAGAELEPGWTTSVGTRNFSAIVHNPLVRNPFLRVFAWTLAFATLTVLLSFAVGLFLAIALDKKGMRLQRVYRSLLVIPYATPGALALLVWAGLLNDDFGVVNGLLGHLGIHVPWLFGSVWWARVSIILVSTWLTFPYFFLVSMGALQSIPTELTEAARVDGGGRWQVFRRVTLPLLLVVVAPLLIASFAFNFNNFNNIYLLTAGGPAANDQSIAGGTDILISYTYKLSFATGKGGDYGLAAAVSILIFFIVATISAISFWRTKALENVR
jgi:arabinogalactan oligomer/maltooligosaccharide transport system permease protein